uniref:Uncharacterized protein n=1 Tax=Anopheles melas TaxID=34690 RepID=A0A182TYJ1_9DIPT
MAPFERFAIVREGGTALLARRPGVQDLIVRVAAADHVGQVGLNALVGLVAGPYGRDFTVQAAQRFVAAHEQRFRLLRRTVAVEIDARKTGTVLKRSRPITG